MDTIASNIRALVGAADFDTVCERSGLEPDRLAAIMAGDRTPSSLDVALVATGLGTSAGHVLFHDDQAGHIAHLEGIVAALQLRRCVCGWK